MSRQIRWRRTLLLAQSQTRVLAVGASGKFTGLVIPELAKRDLLVRGLVRKEQEGEAVRRHGAAEIALGDLTDAASVASALSGVDAVFYVAPAFLPNEAEIGQAFVAAAVTAGVRRFVFSSVIHPVISGLTNHAGKAPVEEAVLNSDLEYTFLHPTLFFQNYAQAMKSVAATGVLAEPWSVDTCFSRVDYRDVAEVAAIALAEDRLLYGTFELCADGWMNRRDVAEAMSLVLGRGVEARRVDPDTLGDQAKPMRPMFDHYDHVGLRGNALTLRAILGREPRTLQSYLAELADADEQS